MDQSDRSVGVDYISLYHLTSLLMPAIGPKVRIKGARTPDTQRPRTFYLMVAMHSLPLLFYF